MLVLVMVKMGGIVAVVRCNDVNGNVIVGGGVGDGCWWLYNINVARDNNVK